MKRTTVEELEQVLGKPHFAFSCTRCGNCCRGPGSVYFTEDDWTRIVEYLGLERPEADRLRARIVQTTENGYLVHNTPSACRFLDKNERCTIYPVRPMQCRSYPFWASFFESEEDLAFLKEECPGVRSGRGERYSLLQTVRRINATERAFLQEQRDKDAPIRL